MFPGYIKFFKSFKVYFNNIPEGHRPMWIYTMYAGMCFELSYVHSMRPKK